MKFKKGDEGEYGSCASLVPNMSKGRLSEQRIENYRNLFLIKKIIFIDLF